MAAIWCKCQSCHWTLLLLSTSMPGPICIRVADSNPLWMHRIGCMVHRWRLWSDSSRSHAEQGKDYYQKTIRACWTRLASDSQSSIFAQYLHKKHCSLWCVCVCLWCVMMCVWYCVCACLSCASRCEGPFWAASALFSSNIEKLGSQWTHRFFYKWSYAVDVPSLS